MSETNPSPATPPADKGQPGAVPPAGTTTTPPATVSPDDFARLQAQLTEATTKLSAFEKAEEERKNAQLSEQERATKELAKVKAELTKSKFEQAAHKAGAKYPAEVVKLLDTAEIADSDEARAAACAELKTRIPDLFGKPSETPATNPGRTTTTATAGQFKRSQLRDTKFYAQNRPAIMQALKEGRIVED